MAPQSRRETERQARRLTAVLLVLAAVYFAKRAANVDGREAWLTAGLSIGALVGAALQLRPKRRRRRVDDEDGE